MRRLLGLFFVTLVGCIDHPDPPALPPGSDQLPKGDPKATGPAQTDPKPTTPPAAAKDPKTVLVEEVYVLFKDFDDGDWMCTGTLVSRDTVLTAAHCLNESRFASWRVIAPLAKDRPEASAAWVAAMTDDSD